MKYLITNLVAIGSLLVFAIPAHAQEAAAGSQSAAGAVSGSQAAAIGIQINTSPSADPASAGTQSTGSAISSTGGSAGGGLGVGIGGSGGSANAHNAGNSQAITFNSTGSDLGKAVGNAVMPALTTTLTDTCMGSASGALGLSGFAGSFGKTYVDEECVRRLHSKFLASAGQGDVAMQIMCGSDIVAEAAATLAERTNGVDKCTGESYVASGPVDTEDDYKWSYPERDDADAFIYHID